MAALMDMTPAVMLPQTIEGESTRVESEPPATPDYLGIARQAFEGSTSYVDTNLRQQWEANIRQWQSKHAMGSKYLSEAWKGKPKFFRPKTRAAIRKHEAAAAAAFFSTQDVVAIAAVDDSNDMQRGSAALWKEVMNHRLTKSVPWFLTVMGAYQETLVIGALVSYQDWDNERDQPNPELCPIENIRIDPASNWLDPMGSSPYVIHMIPMYAYEVKERDDWYEVTDAQLMSSRAQSYDSTRLAREGQRTDPKETGQTGIKDFDVVWVHRVILRRGGEDVVFYTLGTEVLLADPLPVAQVYPWLRKFERPYVMGICVVEAHRTYPSGLPELTRETVREMNELANDRIANVQLVLSKRYLVKRNKQVDIRALVRGTPGSAVMLEDPEKDVKPLEWKDVTASSYQEQDRLNLDHDDLVGAKMSGSTVDSNRRLSETVGGMQLMDSAAQEIGDYTLKTFVETWLERVLSQMLRMEQARESDAVILASAGQKAELIEKFGISAINDELLRQNLTLTVDISMGATNPLNNLEKFMAGLTKLEQVFGAEVVAQRLDFSAVWAEMAGKLGYKDGQRFLLDQEDPRVAALQREIEELTTKLLQKRSPEVDAAQAAKLRAETVKVLTESFFGATQGAELIASVPEIAAVADKILQAAGYQLPTPPGIDPNIPTPAGPVGAPTGANMFGSVATPKGQPGSNTVPGVKPNTSPQQPAPLAKPQSATAGVKTGIENGVGT